MEQAQPGLIDTPAKRVLRIYCTTPGICNHNGTPKPVATVEEDGIWVFCRWSKALEFIPKERVLDMWTPPPPDIENK